VPKTMFLVDGSNHAFRVQFALPPQHTTSFFPTRVLYGFTLLFQKMLRTWRPDYVVVSFDSGKTFRHELYTEYKGHRPEMPGDLKRQWDSLPQLVEAFGYPCIMREGYEADDVLGSLATQFAADDLLVYMVTSDKDFAQLVGPNVRLLDEAKGRELDEAGVVDKYKVKPGQVVDWLALQGDSSDNIPGVPGVGPKTASGLLAKYGDLDAVLAAAAEGKVRGKRGENLVIYADAARMSRTLARIETGLDLGVDLEALVPKGLQEDDLRGLFERWEFGAVARKMLPHREAVDVSGYRAVTTDSGVAELIARLRAAGKFAFSLRTHEGAGGPELIGAAFAWAEGTAYLPLTPRAGVESDGAAAAAQVLELLADPTLDKVAHDLKQYLSVLERMGCSIKGIAGDSRILDYVLVAHRRTHGLDDLAQRHLGHSLAYVPEEEPLLLGDVVRWSIEPAHVAWLTHAKLFSRLEEGTRFIYEQIELPLMPILAGMESAGVRLDLDVLAAVRADIAGRAELAEATCHELAGREFKVNSPKDVAQVLFEELELPKTKKTRLGAWSTDSSVLEGLADNHPLPAAILDYRQLQKLDGTYLSKLPQHVAADGRIHTTFSQTVAATGRLASNDPNMQNIPIRTFEGRRIRDAFVAEPGHVLMSFDYSQVELRVLAHFCGTGALVESFKRGEDIHRRTASEVWKVPMEEVTSEQRSAAKAINFGLLYGMSAFRLGRDLSISRADAQQYMDDYFGRIPQVSQWIDATKASCRDLGYAETLFGRRRLIPEIYSKNYSERAAGEREAVNTVVQGSAADIIKIAMIRVDASLTDAGLPARMVLQVHDELLLEVAAGSEQAVAEVVVREMMGAADLVVPLQVNWASGNDWNAAHG
jgi:DNA polymerase-1